MCKLPAGATYFNLKMIYNLFNRNLLLGLKVRNVVAMSTCNGGGDNKRNVHPNRADEGMKA